MKEHGIDAGKTVGELVAEDVRTAGVFEKYGIDFCCGGNVRLSDICRGRSIDISAIEKELEAAKSTPLDRGQNYGAWDLSFLADYIVNTHHAYLKENLEGIRAYTKKVSEVHGANHPELVEIADIYDKIATDMTAHLREEEEVLFPMVKRVAAAKNAGKEPEQEEAGALRETLAKLGKEHDEVGEAVHTIRRLSGDYAVPPDACNTYRLVLEKLKEFEDDLHKHVHLENNILFPKAV